MAQTFIKTPWAASGDVTTIPDTVQPDGSASFPQGWGPDYQLDPSNPAVLYPERRVMNEILLLLSQNIQLLQVHGFPDYIPAAQNGGVAYSYDINAFVRYTDNNIYYSLVTANTALPTDATKWAMFIQPSPFKTGMTIIHEDSTLPTGGWVWANGQTIGDASSGATGRANADTVTLFTQIWTAFPNSVRPIQDSSGAASTRGANATADYAAHKRLPLRDMRDVAPAGTATMGGTTDRGILTGPTGTPPNAQGVDATIFGATGGEQQHTQILNELASHSHDGSGMTASGPGTHSHNYLNRNTSGTLGINLLWEESNGDGAVIKTIPIGNSTSHTHAITGSTGTAGISAPFNVVQPTTICNFITKL